MRETIDGALEELVTGDRKRDSAPSFAADDEETPDNRTMLEWPPKPRTPSDSGEIEIAATDASDATS
jgi:hypothetical protein